MGTLSVSLVDTANGPRVRIDLSSDSDVLSHEHEDDHRELAAKLLGVPLGALEGLGIDVIRTGSVASGDVAASAPSASSRRGQIGTKGNPGRQRRGRLHRSEPWAA